MLCAVRARRALLGSCWFLLSLVAAPAFAKTPVDRPIEERSWADLMLYGWSDRIGPSLMGKTYYGVGYRLESARWAASHGPAPFLSGVSFTLNRDFLLNVIIAVLVEEAEQNGRVANSMGYVKVGPVSNAAPQTARAQPFSLDVTIFDQVFGSQMNGATADLHHTFVAWPDFHGGATLTVGLTALALGQPRYSKSYAWVSWAGAFFDARVPLGTWFLAGRLRGSFPFIYGRQGAIDQPLGTNLPEDRRYLARLDAMLEGYVTNLLVLGAGVTWGVAQLGDGFGFRAEAGVRF